VLQTQTRGLLVRKGKKAPEDSRALVKTGDDAWVAVKDKETGAQQRSLCSPGLRCS
jgi:hypothetical protein